MDDLLLHLPTWANKGAILGMAFEEAHLFWDSGFRPHMEKAIMASRTVALRLFFISATLTSSHINQINIISTPIVIKGPLNRPNLKYLINYYQSIEEGLIFLSMHTTEPKLNLTSNLFCFCVFCVFLWFLWFLWFLLNSE